MKPSQAKANVRHQAFKALKSVMIEGQSLTQVFQTNEAMPAFAKALCFGVIRDYQRLSIILNKLVAKKPKKQSLQILLMMGIYQLKSSDKPDYACVAETVSLTRTGGISWASGMVNGVLRQFIRERETILSDCETDPAYQWNHPSWLVDKLKQAWPNQFQNILFENDQQAPMTLRINLAKTTCDDYLQLLKDEGIDARLSSLTPTAITLSTATDVYQLPGFEQGLVSVQDAAAQLAAPLLDLKPGQRVLDACSAPGGKTCHMLETESQLKEVVALDISESRLDKVKENLSRLGLSATLICADVVNTEKWWDGQSFDRILLDAPCSATGVIRRHPDIKYHRKPEDLTALVRTQQQMLSVLWQVLKPGGVMVYATCSVLPEENEKQIESFCGKQGDARIEALPNDLMSDSKIGLQLLPKSDAQDGFYYAVLRKLK